MDVLTALLNSQQITQAQFTEAQKAFSNGSTIEEALAQVEVDPDVIREALASYYGIPAYAPPENIKISQDVLEMLPEESARHYGVIPFAIENGVLQVAVNEPDNVQLKEVLNFVSTRHHQPYKMHFVTVTDLERLLNAYASLSGEVGEALTSLETELDAEIAARQSEAKNETSQTEHIEEDAPVTKIVATVLRYAVDGKASDIHIEPFQGKIRVRFRIDGLLQTNLQLPANVQSAVVARVKILSSMRLDERRKPQDGRFSATFDGRKIDFRVSVLPTNAGEKVVMRILDSEKGVHSLDGTGISQRNLDIIRQALKEPYGIILISGPTGSGKSTTLYSMLEEVDKESKNVLSLEDPVEYNIAGVAQSQVKPEIGYTFASGLRSALRQDPDIILVGEIRDGETAQLAIQAALTGHLVFSTIHTNNAIGVVPRLVDMGVDPYLIAPTLKLAVAQRLARRICDGTGTPMPVSGAIAKLVEDAFADLPPQYQEELPSTNNMLRIESTEECPTGTSGRVAVTECLRVDEKIEELILENASEEAMYQVARANGFMSMKEDAIIKAMEHVIPFEEVGTFGSNVNLHDDMDDAIEAESTPTASSEAAGEVATGSDTQAEATSAPDVDNLSLDDSSAV